MTARTTTEARWLEALALLESIPTEPEQRRSRRSRRVAALMTAALVLGLGAAVLVVAVLVSGTVTAGPSGVPTWQVRAGAVLAGAGVLLAGCGAWESWGSIRRAWAHKVPLAALSQRQGHQLADQVRGHRPVEPARLPLARVVAEQQLDQRGVFLLLTGSVVLQIGWQLGTALGPLVILSIGLGCALAVRWVFLRRDARRAETFLTGHPAEGTAPGAAGPEDDPARG